MKNEGLNAEQRKQKTMMTRAGNVQGGNDELRAYTLEELEQLHKEYMIKMDKIFTIDKKEGLLVINVEYPYCIELSRLKSKKDVLAWVAHICEKTWVDTDIIWEFIDRIFKHRKWKMDNP